MSHKPVIVKDSFLNKSIFKTIICSHYSKEKEIFVEYMYLSKYVSSISQCTLIFDKKNRYSVCNFYVRNIDRQLFKNSWKFNNFISEEPLK